MGQTRWICGAMLFGLLLPATSKTATARPGYGDAFQTTYAREFSGNAEATKCTVCHFGPVKRSRNDYGMAVTKALKTRNERDAAAIRTALEAAAKQPSAVKGKTFGDLIKQGKLPGKAPTTAGSPPTTNNSQSTAKATDR
jgi:hypothetical protein